MSKTIPIVCLRVFQPTSSMRRTTAKTEKILYLPLHNTAIYINSQPQYNAHTPIHTNTTAQAPTNPVRSIRAMHEIFRLLYLKA